MMITVYPGISVGSSGPVTTVPRNNSVTRVRVSSAAESIPPRCIPRVLVLYTGPPPLLSSAVVLLASVMSSVPAASPPRIVGAIGTTVIPV